MKIFWTKKQLQEFRSNIKMKSFNKGHKQGYDMGYKKGKELGMITLLRALNKKFDISRK